MSNQNLVTLARNIRENIVNCIGSLGVGHIGGCLSIADLLAVLYGKHMNYDPKNPSWKVGTGWFVQKDTLVLVSMPFLLK